MTGVWVTCKEMLSSLTYAKIGKLHSYAASFGNDLAYELIFENTDTNNVYLDPWAGSGTGLLQARALGRNSIGIDIDPVACLIARTTTSSYTLDELESLSRSVDSFLNRVLSTLSSFTFDEAFFAAGARFSINGVSGAIPNSDKISFWFAPLHRALLSTLVEFANSFRDQRLRDILFVSISSAIIHKWPNTLSQAMDIDHSRPHRVLREGLSLQSQVAVFRRVFGKNISTLRKINGLALYHTALTEILQRDSCQALSSMLPDSIDYILTSPPYFNAIDYPRAHQFSKWWLWPELKKLSRRDYVGLRPAGGDHATVVLCSSLIADYMPQIIWLKDQSLPKFRSLCKYIVDIDLAIKGMRRVLRPNKKVTFILANNSIKDHVIPIVDIVSYLFEKNRFVDVTSKERQIDSSRRRYPYGIKGFKGLMRTEYIINAVKSSS